MEKLPRTVFLSKEEDMPYKIEEARRARGWSQAELAKRAGISQQAVQRYESGEREPRVSSVIAMASALGVTLSYLLGLDSPDGNGITPDESRLVAMYRSADSRGKALIMMNAEANARASEKEDL